MSKFGMSLSAAYAAISINPYFANAIRQAQKAEEEKIKRENLCQMS